MQCTSRSLRLLAISLRGRRALIVCRSLASTPICGVQWKAQCVGLNSCRNYILWITLLILSWLRWKALNVRLISKRRLSTLVSVNVL